MVELYFIITSSCFLMFELLDGEKGGGFYSDSFLEFMYPMTLGLMICFSTTLGYRRLMRLHT